MLLLFLGFGRYIPEEEKNLMKKIKVWSRHQCCDLETMVSRLECTRVYFVQVSVLVSRLKKGLDNNTDRH